MESLIGQNSVQKLFMQFVKTKTVPHLILYGNSGVGKTMSVFLLRNLLFDKGTNAHCVLYLNGSDSNGIDVVRNQIVLFCKQPINAEYKNQQKLIIIDEADALTSDFQKAMKLIIEDFSKSTSFIFICNYQTNIIQALQSRCLGIQYNKLTDENLKTILGGELPDEHIMKTAVLLSNGDARKIKTYASVYENLQKTSDNIFQDMFGFTQTQIEHIFDICLGKSVTELVECAENSSHIPLIAFYDFASTKLQQATKKCSYIIQLSQVIGDSDVYLFKKTSKLLIILNFMIKFKQIYQACLNN